MIVEYFFDFRQKIYDSLEKFTQGSHWKVKYILGIVFLTLTLSLPSYHMMEWSSSFWEAFETKSENLFTHLEYPAGSHEAKFEFRMTIPIIAHILQLDRYGILFLQYIFGILGIVLVLNIFIRETSNKVISILLTSSFAFIWAGKSSFVDHRAMFDGIAIFFLMCSLYFRNFLIVILVLLMAFFVDERALICSSFLFIYNLVTAKSIFNKRNTYLFVSWVMYFILRGILSWYFHFSTDSFNIFDHIIPQLYNLPMGLWSGLEGFWILVFGAIGVLTIQRKFSIAFLYFILISIGVAVAISVYDITRSMCYLFISVFPAMALLVKSETDKSLKNLSFYCLALCFMFPTYYSRGVDEIIYTPPIFIHGIQYLFNHI
jgi:hypothetical protein